MKLSDLKTGEKAVIVKVLGHGGFRKRIIEMGFIKGKLVKVLLNAPLKDPVKYKIMGYEVSLRHSEADLIEVVSEDDMTATVRYSCHDRCDSLETPCGFIDVTWRRGRTYNGVDELAPFVRFGAGIGYDGSDYVVKIEPLFFTERLDKNEDVSNDNLHYPYIVRERRNGETWGRAVDLETAKLLLLSLEDTDRDFNRAELNKYEIYNSTTGKIEQGDQND